MTSTAPTAAERAARVADLEHADRFTPGWLSAGFESEADKEAALQEWGGRPTCSPIVPRAIAAPTRPARTAPASPAPWVADAMAGGLVTVREACALLRMSRRNLYRLTSCGKLHAVKQGVAGSARLLIPRAALAAYLTSLAG